MVPEKKLILIVLLFLVTVAILDSWPNPKFVILKPWSLIILQVKFENNCLSGFRKKSCLKLFKYAIFRYGNVTLVNRK